MHDFMKFSLTFFFETFPDAEQGESGAMNDFIAKLWQVLSVHTSSALC